MKAIKIFVTIFVCAFISMCTTSCCSSCNEENSQKNSQNNPVSYIVTDSTINGEVFGKFDWKNAGGWGRGRVKIIKILIGNHEYLMTDHSHTYSVGICHYEDCKYCKEHIVKAELVK